MTRTRERPTTASGGTITLRTSRSVMVFNPALVSPVIIAGASPAVSSARGWGRSWRSRWS
ncbi:hypothetical protein [Actinomadura sp. K4S16]|uniref:hypothetical protein n=1 Tax=Actinomadura sp. K4S16 TaxID=1316147 RepID=UPI0011EC0D69|nr:hypothetical protein [Actinomadura sp. K4S16]